MLGLGGSKAELLEPFRQSGQIRRDTTWLEESPGEGKLGSFESGAGFAFDAEPGGGCLRKTGAPERKQQRSLLTDPPLLDGELGRRGLLLLVCSAALEYY